MEERYDSYEEEINIGDMLLDCLGHFKSILLAAIIGLLLGLVFCMATGKAPDTVAEIETEDAALEEEKQLLSEKEQEKETMEKLLRYSQQKVESLNGYLETTKLMELDPYALYQGNVIYTISAAEADMADISSRFKAYRKDGSLLEALKEQTGLYEVRDLEQLVSFEVMEENSLVWKNDSWEFSMSGTENLADEETFVIHALGQSKTEAEILLAASRSIVEGYFKSLADSYSLLQLHVEEENVSETVSRTLADYQASLILSLSEENENLNDRRSKLEELTREIEEESAAEKALESGLSKKQLVLYAGGGAFLGAFLTVGIWVLAYLFGGRLYTTEVEKRFQIKVLGRVCDTSGKKGLDRFVSQKKNGIYSILPKEEQQEIVLSHVKNELKKKCAAGSRVFLSSTLGDTLAAEAAFLTAGLGREGYEVSALQGVLGQADALEKIAEAEAVIVVESPSLSRTVLVGEQMHVLKEYAKAVAGMVMIERN